MPYNYGRGSYGYNGHEPPISSCTENNEYGGASESFYDGPCNPCVKVTLGGFFDWHGNTNWPSDYGGWHPGFVHVSCVPCKPVIPTCDFLEDGQSQLNFDGCDGPGSNYYENARWHSGPLNWGPDCGCYLDCEPREWEEERCEPEYSDVNPINGGYGDPCLPKYDPCSDPCGFDFT